MEWMKSFSTFSRITFDNGLHCAEGEPVTLPDLRGNGVEKAGCQQGPWTEMKTVVLNPKQLFFCGRIFRRVFRCVLSRTFRRTYRRAFSLHFSPHLSPGLCLQIVMPRHSIHVTTKRLCQKRWQNINNTEKHAIMEEGADMPETHCLSHPLCLRTLMENTCDTHCAPSHQIYLKKPESNKKNPLFSDFSLHFSLCGL